MIEKQFCTHWSNDNFHNGVKLFMMVNFIFLQVFTTYFLIFHLPYSQHYKPSMYYIFHLSQFGGNFTKIILDDIQTNLSSQVKIENERTLVLNADYLEK